MKAGCGLSYDDIFNKEKELGALLPCAFKIGNETCVKCNYNSINSRERGIKMPPLDSINQGPAVESSPLESVIQEIKNEIDRFNSNIINLDTQTRSPKPIDPDQNGILKIQKEPHDELLVPILKEVANKLAFNNHKLEESIMMIQRQMGNIKID